MALKEFSGELDQLSQQKLTPFTGALDTEPSAAPMRPEIKSIGGGLMDAVKQVGRVIFGDTPSMNDGQALNSLPPEPAKFDFASASRMQRKLDDSREQRKTHGTIGPVVGPAASAGSIARGLVTDVATGAKRANAGVDQMLGDLTGMRSYLEAAKRGYAQADLTSAMHAPQFESETAAGIYGGLSSMARQAIPMAASIATRNPGIGLAGMTVPMVPEKYGEYRLRGETPVMSLLGAGSQAGVEYLTEKMPMTFLVNKMGRAGAGKFLTGLLAREVPGEQLATLVQDAIDTAVENPTMTWGEYVASRPSAAYQTLLATLTQGGIMGGVNSGMNRMAQQPAQPSAEDMLKQHGWKPAQPLAPVQQPAQQPPVPKMRRAPDNIKMDPVTPPQQGGIPTLGQLVQAFQPGATVADDLRQMQPQQPVSVGQKPAGKAPDNVTRFAHSVRPVAERVAQQLRVPVEAVIGQWGLETGWGRSVIPGTNNLGNIKDFSGRGVAATDNMTKSRDRYRAYSSVDEFAGDFSNLIGNGRYRAVPGSKNAASYFDALKAAGYAEDPGYVSKGVSAARMAAAALGKPFDPGHAMQFDGQAQQNGEGRQGTDMQLYGAAQNQLGVEHRAALPDDPKAPDAGPMPIQQGSIDTGASDMFDAILQNRDRSTPGSIQQMQAIAANPDYGRMGYSRDFANGAPVVAGGTLPQEQLGRQDYAVASDGRRIPVQYAVVEADQVQASNTVDGLPNQAYGDRNVAGLRAIAGNGRIAGVQSAYGAGRAGVYTQELIGDNMHGIDPGVVQRMRQPVLVRVMPQSAVTRDIGDVSNTVGNLSMSAVEQARNDARRLPMESLQFSPDGSMTPETVRQFVRGMPTSEQGAMLDNNGQPTRQAVDRAHAAVFAAAYGNDGLVRLYAQAQDPEARIIMSALAQAAPQMARLEGAGDLDIRELVTQAAEIAVNARRDGRTIQQAAEQLDLATDQGVLAVLDLFAANPRSAKPVADALQRAAQFAYTEANKDGTDMFGEVPRATRQDVLAQLNEGGQNGTVTEGQTDLWQPAGRQPDAGNAGQPAADAAGQGDAAGAEAGRTTAGQREDAAAGNTAGDFLSSYTPEEVRQRQGRAQQLDEQQARNDRAAEQRARADAELGDFALTGSDRAADVNPDQEVMFSRRSGAMDAEYMAAVERGDMETAQRLVNEAAADAGYGTDSSHRMNHEAPNSQDGFSISMDAIRDSDFVPADYWTHPEWYQTDSRERVAFGELRSMFRDMDARKAAGQDPGAATITVYRAVPKSAKDSKIRNGDWVSPSEAYARDEGALIPGGFRIISQQVPAQDLWWDGNSSAELGYDDGHGYAYKNTKNNRKLLDPVTYDDQGNVIPLNKRFSPRNADERYSRSPAPIGTTVSDIRDAIRKAYGHILTGLERGGKVQLAQTEMDAIEAAAQARADKRGTSLEAERSKLMQSMQASRAEDVDVKRSESGAIQGFYDPATGKSFLIADNLTAEAAPAVLLHEVGIHMSSDGSLDQVFRRAKQLVDGVKGNPFIDRVRERMDSAGETSAEEAAAYMAEEYERDRLGAPNTVKAWIESFVARIRAWLHSKGVLNADRLTEADIAAIARANLKQMAGTDKRSDAPSFSRAGQQQPLQPTNQQYPLQPMSQQQPPTNNPPPAHQQGNMGQFGGGAPWTVDRDVEKDNLIRAMQNNKIDLKRVVDAVLATGKKIADNANPYLADELYIGRVTDGLEQLTDRQIKPLLRAIADSGVDPLALEKYLHALHAEERNRQMAKVNNHPFDLDYNMSGMSTREARQIIQDVHAGAQASDMQRLATMVHAITRETRRRLVAEGLATVDEITAWEGAYKNYVPLMRDTEESGGRSQGYNVKGMESRRAMGSQAEAKNILANVVAQAEASIIRSEKARVGRAMLEFAKQNPNPDFWTVNRAPTERAINKDTGLVENRVVPNFKNADTTLVVKVNGEEQYIVFNEKNARAVALVRNLKNMDVADLNAVTQGLGKINRYMATWVTSRNPFFWITNFARDAQGVVFNLQDTAIRGKELSVGAALPKAFGAVTMAEAGKPGSGLMARYYREFSEAGGKTGYIKGYRDSVERMGDITKEIERLGQTAYDPRKIGRSLLDVIDSANDVVENGVRLAVYSTARQNGVSIDQAASIAKNITVNFNRKGNHTGTLNSLYMFSNAGIQGNVRMIQAIKSSRRAQVYAGGLMMAGMMMTALNILLGADDEETRKKRYELVPEYERERSWILMIPGSDDYVKVPLPIGPHILFNTGRVLVETAMLKDRKALDAAGSLLASTLASINPVGGGLPSKDLKGLAQTLTPSAVRPITDLAVNQNFAGTPIAKEAFGAGGYQKPAYQRTRDKTPGYWKDAAEVLNDWTGGDEVKPGAINTTPEALAYLVKAYTVPGIAQAADKTARAMTTEQGEITRLPGVDRFFGRIDEVARDRAAWDRAHLDVQASGEIKQYLARGERNKATAALIELGGGDEAKGRRIAAMAEGRDKQLREINAMKTKARKIEDSERRDAALQRLDARASQINARYMAAINR